jgi:hypothetical protein
MYETPSNHRTVILSEAPRAFARRAAEEPATMPAAPKLLMIFNHKSSWPLSNPKETTRLEVGENRHRQNHLI